VGRHFRFRALCIAISPQFELAIHNHFKIRRFKVLPDFTLGAFMNRFLATTSLAVIALLATPLDGSRSLSGPPPVLAQQSVTLENLSFKGALASIRIPRVVIDGSNVSKADIEALLDTKILSDLSGRLSKISARSVSIPTVEITQNIPGAENVTVYKDTVFRDVQNGIIGEWVTPLTTTRAKPDPKSKVKDVPLVDMDMVNMVLKSIDLPLMLRFALDKAAPGETLKTVAAEQTVGKLTYRIGDMGSFVVQSFYAKDFKLKPLKTPMMEMITQLEKQTKNKSSDGDKAALDFAADLLASMSFQNMEMNGMSGEFKIPGEAKPFKLEIQKIAAGGGADVPGRFTFQGLKTSMSAGTFNMGELTMDGVTFGGMLASLQKMAAGNAADLSNFNPADAIPRIDLIRLAGVDFDIADPKSGNQRIKAKLGLFETKMGNHVGPIPANVGMTVDRFQMDIPKGTKEKGLNDMLALGYSALDVSARYDQTWDEASKTLNLNELSMRSVGMFSTRFKAEMHNVSKEIFTLDKAVAAVAALGVSARSLDAQLANEGLFEKLMAQQANQQKRKPEDVRAELAAGATMMVPMMLGEHPAAKILGEALGKFVAQPKNLQINVKARDAGLGAADFIAVKNPMDLLKKVDITAAANQ
jgi:hypothetical protein